jgi:hypothetical protein
MTREKAIGQEVVIVICPAFKDEWFSVGAGSPAVKNPRQRKECQNTRLPYHDVPNSLLCGLSRKHLAL